MTTMDTSENTIALNEKFDSYDEVKKVFMEVHFIQKYVLFFIF